MEKMKSLFKSLIFFRSWLSKKYLPFFFALLAILLSLPALNAGLIGDDWFQRYYFINHKTLCGQEIKTTFFQFRSAEGSQESFRRCIDSGITPWWGTVKFRLLLWRPLGEITHRIDYYLWPDSISLMHIHSLFWLGLMILAVSILYRRIIGPVWIAGLAALLFTFDDSHMLPSVWLANRWLNLAVFFSVLALIFHDKWRKDRWRPGIFFGPASLLAGLLSGESAIATCAYLFSYTLFIDDERLVNRIISLIPYTAIAVVYLFAYKTMGYGAFASGLYIDPLSEPIEYAIASFERIPVLLFGQWSIVNPEIYLALPDQHKIAFQTISISFLILTCAAIIPLLVRNRSSKFWSMGMLLSLLPFSWGVANRSLTFAAIGAFGLLAQFIGIMLDKSVRQRERKPCHIYAFCMLTLFAFMHLVAAPFIYLVSAKFYCSGNAYKILVDSPAKSPLLNADGPDQQTILVNNPSHLFFVNIISQRLVKGLPVSKYNRTLADGSDTIKVDRIDNRTIVVYPKSGFITGLGDTLWRGESYPMEVGQRVELTGMTAEVLSLTKDMFPKKVKFRFDKPLEDRSYKFLQWTDKGYILFSLPSTNETVIIPATKTISRVISESF